MAELLELKTELEPYKNTLVINFDEVVRLIDVVEDEDDYYWMYDTNRGIIKSSCVCGWIPLKGIIPDKDYIWMLNIWNLNHDEKAI